MSLDNFGSASTAFSIIEWKISWTNNSGTVFRLISPSSSSYPYPVNKLISPASKSNPITFPVVGSILSVAVLFASIAKLALVYLSFLSFIEYILTFKVLFKP